MLVDKSAFNKNITLYYSGNFASGAAGRLSVIFYDENNSEITRKNITDIGAFYTIKNTTITIPNNTNKIYFVMTITSDGWAGGISYMRFNDIRI